MDIQKIAHERAELEAQMKAKDDEIQGYLSELFGKRTEAVIVKKKIEEEQLKDVKADIQQLETEIDRIMKIANIERSQHAGYRALLEEKRVFKVVDWEKLNKFIKDYKGEFDVFSLIKREIKNASFKEYLEKYAECPAGVTTSSFKQVGFRSTGGK